jgi:hypothetical protein
VSIDGSQCAIVDEHVADHLTVRDVSGGDAYRFSIPPDQQIEAGSVAVGTPMQMGFSAGVYGVQQSFWVWQGEPCG